MVALGSWREEWALLAGRRAREVAQRTWRSTEPRTRTRTGAEPRECGGPSLTTALGRGTRVKAPESPSLPLCLSHLPAQTAPYP